MTTEHTPNGIMYKWYLVGPQGAGFILFPEKSHTKEDINRAKLHLRNSQDVVTLRLANIDDRVDHYKAKVFEHPATRPLKWYQIAQDELVLKREMLKGTTPDEYVQQFVLPYIEETEQVFLARYGEDIYHI